MQIKNRRPRRGYTLIELMAVVTIIGILATLTVGASLKYMATARARATEAMLQILDLAVTQRTESFWFKVKPAPLPTHQVLAGVGLTNEPRLVQLKRASLIAKLDAMRGDFPQQFSDFLPTPAGGFSVGVASKTRTAIERKYRELTYAKNPGAVPNNNVATQPTQIAPHDPLAESSACLYLMLLVGSGEGNAFDMSQVKPEFIRDTDGDGIPEFVDSWGTPLRFYRWPTDYLTYLYTGIEPTPTDPNLMIPPPAPPLPPLPPPPAPQYIPYDFPGDALDPGGLLQSTVWSNYQNASYFSNARFGEAFGTSLGYFRVRDANGAPFIYPTYPLIVSAGPDATSYTREYRWQSFGLSFDDSETKAPPFPQSVPLGQINYSWPAIAGAGAVTPAQFMAIRMGKPVMTPGVPNSSPPPPGSGACVDNIVSRRIRAGQEHQ